MINSDISYGYANSINFLDQPIKLIVREKSKDIDHAVGDALENIRLLTEKTEEIEKCIHKIDSYYKTTLGSFKKFSDDLKGENAPLYKAQKVKLICQSLISKIESSPEYKLFQLQKTFGTQLDSNIYNELSHEYIHNTEVFIIEKHNDLFKLCEKAQIFAKELYAKKSVWKVPQVKGQQNVTGNNCYMNSSLQCLEATFAKGAQNLLQKNLALIEGESLLDLEKRLLKEWSPISENLPAEERACQIIFKWTYLLVLQAKSKGQPSGSNTVSKALRLHHEACFTLKKHQEFWINPWEQKDAASYMEYWHNMLGVQFDLSIQTSTDYQKRKLNKLPKIEKYGILQMPIGTGSYKSLQALILGQSVEKMTPEKGGNENKVEFEHPDYEGVTIPVSSYTHTTRIASPPPEFMTLHFKRFLMDSNFTSFKDQSKLPINLDECSYLNLSELFSKDVLKEGEAIYQVKALSVHKGIEVQSGHYISYVKDKGKWFCCDDDKVYPVPFQSVPFRDAYMMTLERI